MATKKNKTDDRATKPQVSEDIQKTDLAGHAELSYLEYSMSVVKGRAIPYVEDGLKPVQRRVLFAMRELGLAHNEKPKKSARVVGDVIGKYHPHGDTAVYDAMVRTAQNFSLRYPLVEGTGNFGSRDGDSAAAMRYTEARLTAFADTFLSELDKETVDWRTNYDNTMQEPGLLPSRLPNILLNGASGIGVGLATELPPHNLVETVDAAIAMIKNPKMTLDEIMEFIPGPDYPTGGQIISSHADIKRAYSEKRGSIRIRARYRVENEGTKNWKIVFYELPQPTSTQKIMEEVDSLFNPKPKEKNNKKIFSHEQLRLKTVIANLIENYTDGSDQDSPIRLVFEPKSHKQDPQELINTLLAYTSLETNSPINLVVVGRDKSPRARSLDEILREWTEFRVDTVFRRTTFEHQKAADRLHILEGRQTILDHIEEVIQILKTAEEPRAALMKRFGLSEIQADDVMEIRLRQLARLEHHKILEEMQKLQDEIKRLTKLLESKAAMRAQVIKELEADKKVFGDARRSLIEPAERVALKAVEEQSVSDDPITVAISERGWIRVRTGHQHGADAFAFKTGDAVKEIYRAKLTDQAIFLDDAGKSYSQALKDLPSAKGGEDVPIATLADFGGAKLAFAIVPRPDDKVVLATDAGYGFICRAADLVTRMRAGKSIVTLDQGARLLPPLTFSPSAIDPAQTLFSTLSSNGRLLCYRLSEINELAKGKGVALCGLDDDARLSQVALWPTNVLTYQIEGLKKPINMSEQDLARHVQGRSSSKKGKTVEGAKNRKIELVSPSSFEPEDPQGA